MRSSSKRRGDLGDRLMLEGLSIQEGQNLVQSRNQMEEFTQTVSTEPVAEAQQRPTRAPPPRCSDCHTLEHRRLQCPNRNRT